MAARTRVPGHPGQIRTVGHAQPDDIPLSRPCQSGGHAVGSAQCAQPFCAGCVRPGVPQSGNDRRHLDRLVSARPRWRRRRGCLGARDLADVVGRSATGLHVVGHAPGGRTAEDQRAEAYTRGPAAGVVDPARHFRGGNLPDQPTRRHVFRHQSATGFADAAQACRPAQPDAARNLRNRAGDRDSADARAAHPVRRQARGAAPAGQRRRGRHVADPARRGRLWESAHRRS